MSARSLLACFDAWRTCGEALVLATVVETEGSTYTKAGHRILINSAGDYQGLVSGGCLEGDLAVHAQNVLATGKPRLITYDLRSAADDELFGLAVGCQGLLRILLQRLTPAGDFEPFSLLAGALRGDEAGLTALVTEGPRAGALLISTTAGVQAAGLESGLSHGPDTDWAARVAVACRAPGPLPRFITVDPDPARILCTRLRPLPWLLVLGAGLDARPVVGLADLLGYRVSLRDHRPAYLERGGFDTAERRACTPAAELATHEALGRYQAALVMSHHLPSDRAYLRALAASEVPYVGLLGPAHRRERLLRELGADGASLAGRLHGPAGFDIGADSPESIALSIFAQLQAVRGRP